MFGSLDDVRESLLAARLLREEVLAIPVHPMLSDADLATIVEAVRAVATPVAR